VDSDTAVLFGGLSPTGTLNDVWEYKVGQKKWTRLHEGGVGPLDTDPYSTVPSPRTGHAAVVLRGDLFIFGGYDPDRGDTNDVWKFTRATGVWSHVTLAAGAERARGRRLEKHRGMEAAGNFGHGSGWKLRRRSHALTVARRRGRHAHTRVRDSTRTQPSACFAAPLAGALVAWVTTRVRTVRTVLAVLTVRMVRACDDGSECAGRADVANCDDDADNHGKPDGDKSDCGIVC